jgi:hypothetical protein
MLGWLSKIGPKKNALSTWRRRFFQLLYEVRKLHYYEDEACRSQLGTIDLVHAILVRPVNLSESRQTTRSDEDLADDAKQSKSGAPAVATAATPSFSFTENQVHAHDDDEGGGGGVRRPRGASRGFAAAPRAALRPGRYVRPRREACARRSLT